ncbi:TRIC cation channel family protein, partial [Aliarcobacter butzleri]
VSFSIAGAIIAINSGFNFLSVLILAFITAVGGGTIRDILINKVPFILVSEFYASVALIVGIAVYILELFEIRNLFTLSIVFILGVALRIVAYYRKWHLPTLSKEN